VKSKAWPIKPSRAFCVANVRDGYLLPYTTATLRRDCVRRFCSTAVMSWEDLKKNGFRVVAVMMMPMGRK